jgi:hypothetical protein
MHIRNQTRLVAVPLIVIGFSLWGCGRDDKTAGTAPENDEVQRTAKALDGVAIAPGPGGVYTTNCQAVCNASGVLCGAVQDPLNPQFTCCCIGGCPGWGPTCAAGVAQGTILPGFSPAGAGVFTANCEATCNAAGVTCGTVGAPNGQTCCCVGSCPAWANQCAEGVAGGAFGPGVAPAPGGGVFTANCEATCNAAGVTCGAVAAPNGQTCCCIGSCPQNAAACAAGVMNGGIRP